MKIHQTFRIEEELQKKAKKQAKKENRALGNLIETSVMKYMNEIESYRTVKNKRAKREKDEEDQQRREAEQWLSQTKSH